MIAHFSYTTKLKKKTKQNLDWKPRARSQASKAKGRDIFNRKMAGF
jgi:hypothetical protein